MRRAGVTCRSGNRFNETMSRVNSADARRQVVVVRLFVILLDVLRA